MNKPIHILMSLLLAYPLMFPAAVCVAQERGTSKGGSGEPISAASARIENDLPVPAAPSNPKAYSNRENAVTVSTEDGKYRVSLYSNQYPLPVGKVHSWIAHIETPDGKPVADAKLYIHGGMPAHRHGFPTKPRAKQYLGKGDYRIDGVKFSMAGRWEMRINIKQTTRRDRAVYQIQL